MAKFISRNRAGIKDKNLSTFSLILIIVTLFMVALLALQDVRLGVFYFILAATVVVVFVLIKLYLRESEERWGIIIPIAESDAVAAGRWLLGVAIPLILAPFIAVWKIMHPLQFYSAASTTVVTSLESLKVSLSPFWQVVGTGFIAPNIEEIFTGLLFAVVAVMIVNYFLKNYRPTIWRSTPKRKLYQFIGATVMSAVVFSILHSFNPNYSGIMFLWAGIFRGIMNGAMIAGLGLEFTMGYHLSNNLVYLGWDLFKDGILTNPAGIALIFVMLILVGAVLTIKSSTIRQGFKNALKS